MQSDSQKIVFASKIQFLRPAEYDHYLRIKNVVVAYQNQVFINQSVRCCRMPGVIRQRHPFLLLWTCVMSILSCRQINGVWLTKTYYFIRLYRPTADVSRHYVFNGSSTFEMHADKLDWILISGHWSSLVNVYPETSFKSLSSSTPVLHYSLRQYRVNTQSSDELPLWRHKSKGSDSPLQKSREISRIINYQQQNGLINEDILIFY